ncbi:NADH-quinone oxidoreductase subunit C [Desulfotomaculum defluvii]
MNGKPLSELIEELNKKYPSLEVSEKGYIMVPPDALVPFMKDLKNNYGFNYLTNLTAADYMEYFEVVYNLCIIGQPEMLHIKTKIDRNDPKVPSMVPIWGGAIWQEREVYDLLGITFTDHPDLRRILLTDEWEGHPLRKDYQWVGGRD